MRLGFLIFYFHYFIFSADALDLSCPHPASHPWSKISWSILLELKLPTLTGAPRALRSAY